MSVLTTRKNCPGSACDCCQPFLFPDIYALLITSQYLFVFVLDTIGLVFLLFLLSFLTSFNGTPDSRPTFSKVRQGQGVERELCLEIITLYFAEVLVLPCWQLQELTGVIGDISSSNFVSVFIITCSYEKQRDSIRAKGKTHTYKEEPKWASI